jgi:hypothetical protein
MLQFAQKTRVFLSVFKTVKKHEKHEKHEKVQNVQNATSVD